MEAKEFVQITDAWEEAEFRVILTDHCEHGSVAEMLKRRKYLHQTEVQFIMKSVLECLKYMRRKRVVHRNISLQYIFINELMQCKLGYFDDAVKLLEDSDRRDSPVGRLIYQSPQMIEEKGYSYDIDLWAFGICLYQLLTGKPPYFDRQ